MQDGPAPGRGDDYFGGTGGAVEEGILARLVEVEAVMRVLERGHAEAARNQQRDELGDQRGFTRPTPAGETDDTHGSLIAKRPAVRPGVASQQRDDRLFGRLLHRAALGGTLPHLFFIPEQMALFGPIDVDR